MATAAPRYVRAADAVLKQVGETEAVYVRSRRALHVLNGSARLVYDYLRQPLSVAELARTLSDATRAEIGTVRQDLETTLPEFVRRGLITRIE